MKYISRYIFSPIVQFLLNLQYIFMRIHSFNLTLTRIVASYTYTWQNACKTKQRIPYNPSMIKSERLIVLANGPSMVKDYEVLKQEGNIEKCEFLMMNFSANSDLFLQLKPSVYCLADPMFFKADTRIEKVRGLFDALNTKVDWDMTLVLTVCVEDFKAFSQINNPHIKMERVLNVSYEGPEHFRFYMYRHGWCVPERGTVANLAVLYGIQKGYKRIELCGIDMTFFEGICVNEKNELCTLEKHFYDKDDVIFKKPFVYGVTGEVMSLSMYIDMVGKMVKSHNMLKSYGDSLGVSFLNRTECSMLDSYPRLKNKL